MPEYTYSDLVARRAAARSDCIQHPRYIWPSSQPRRNFYNVNMEGWLLAVMGLMMIEKLMCTFRSSIETPIIAVASLGDWRLFPLQLLSNEET